MSYTYRRSYRGPIEAVILDWAGTTLDFGCVAPAVVFVEVFKRQGVTIDMAEARGPRTNCCRAAHTTWWTASPISSPAWTISRRGWPGGRSRRAVSRPIPRGLRIAGGWGRVVGSLGGHHGQIAGRQIVR